MVIEKMEGYIPRDKRKKILLMCDDIRTHSGIATVAKEIVMHTCQHYNYVNIGAAINHPEAGKKLDLSQETSKLAGIDDSSVFIYPNKGYGDPNILRRITEIEKPDAIFIITDPRYWTWLFQIENEIRTKIPIIYLNIWDDYPAPMYNKEYYESCDLLMGISKQTVNINKLVLGDKAKDKLIKYLPHGLNHLIFKPLEKDNTKLQEFKNNIFKGKEFDFVAHFNSRNIRRKQVPDTIWAFKQFVDKLDLKQAQKCALLLHTQVVDNNGTDLDAVVEALCGDDPRYNVIIIPNHFSPEEMNLLYNSTDVQIQLTSNEGWGLSLTEAMLVGNPIIANVTGGMQDQMRFVDDQGKWFTPDAEIPSNNTKRYTQHGEWAFPVYPVCRSIQGSPPTPYIWDDRCNPTDATQQLLEVYNLSPEKRKEIGLKGREWALSKEAGFTSKHQGYKVMENVDELFNTWKPRKRYEIIKIDGKKAKKVVPHKLEY